MPGRRTVVGALVALALVAGVGVWQRDRLLGSGPEPVTAAEAMARAWQEGRLETAPWDGDPAVAATRFAGWTAGMDATGRDRPERVVASAGSPDGDRATGALEVTWLLGGDERWTYTSPVELRRVQDDWRVVLRPALAHPQLGEAQRLEVSTTPAGRADVLGAGDAPLVTDREVVAVGLEPRRATDLAASVQATVAQLARVDVELDGAALLARATAAAPDAFVEVVTLREAIYQQVRPELQALPGTVFRRETRPLAPSGEFARALLGTAGPATAEVVEASGGRVRAGDVAGLSGLQAQYDEQLAGQPGLRVEAVSEEAETVDPVAVYERPAAAGTPLRLTLDPAVQQAADDALGAAATPAALVAVRATTGEVLAVANGGAGGAGYNRALLGRYPPGSTFKIASTLALLREGLQPTDVVACPETTTVNGKSFKNAEREVLGPVPFATDFADSCNTAFVDSAPRITGEQLAAAGRDLGYAPYDLGVVSGDSQVPPSDDPVEHAAAMIGQGTVLANPLAVTVSAASVAAGRTVTPYLLADRAAPPGPPLDGAQVSALQALMRGVVTGGTGTALAGVPGGPVAGKTGTAEYGEQVPPRTHAWFAGYQGDVAFAVLVEDGGFGAATAAPLAAAFLTDLRTP